MKSFLDSGAPTVQIGDINHIIYLIGLSIIMLILFKFRLQIKAHPEGVMLGILIFAVVQRIVSVSYYLLIGELTMTESLPLHICRLVCYLIIIQFFVRQEWLDQVIFYFGIFAYASFVYPLGISPALHMLGMSFFMLHSLNIVYPFIRHFLVGFVPTVKGALQSAIIFSIYLSLMQLLNNIIGSNYFYTKDRPFLHDMKDPAYFLLNMFGVSLGFVLVGLIIRFVIHRSAKRKARN